MLAFIYLPLVVIGIYAFNERASRPGRSPGFTLQWFGGRSRNPGVRDALLTSLQARLAATAIALVLGTLASLAVQRYQFFGRETVSFLLILPDRPARAS